MASRYLRLYDGNPQILGLSESLVGIEKTPDFILLGEAFAVKLETRRETEHVAPDRSARELDIVPPLPDSELREFGRLAVSIAQRLGYEGNCNSIYFMYHTSVEADATWHEGS